MASPQPREVTYLPQELFQMILAYLEAEDVVRCRRVSRTWYEAFANPTNLIPILRERFPRAKEVRELCQTATPNCGEDYSEKSLRQWRAVFDNVSERYFRLARGRPRSIQKLNLHVNKIEGYQTFGVSPWEFHASHFGDDTVDMFF